MLITRGHAMIFIYLTRRSMKKRYSTDYSAEQCVTARDLPLGKPGGAAANTAHTDLRIPACPTILLFSGRLRLSQNRPKDKAIPWFPALRGVLPSPITLSTISSRFGCAGGCASSTRSGDKGAEAIHSRT